MSNIQNLKPWQPGQSGNPSGKPKGTKHLSSWIQELMEDEEFIHKVKGGKTKKEVPIKAIVTTLILKAIDGDTKAFDLLAKYGYGTKHDITSKNQQLPMPIFSMDTKEFLKKVS